MKKFNQQIMIILRDSEAQNSHTYDMDNKDH